MLDTAVDVVGNFDATMDSLYVIREGAFGFLTEAKDSPYPWMFAASVIAGALPLALVFFGFGWVECVRIDCGLVSFGG
tara:strand:+ start:428 stop:661 length:234 start_codon:yes stop_codon:yes gene_type:complete